MVPNVEGLVIVPSILVVNELYISCKEKQQYLDRDTGSRDKMIVLIFPFHFILLLFSVLLDLRLLKPKVGQGVRACILREARL